MDNNQFPDEKIEKQSSSSKALELEILQIVSAALMKLKPDARSRLINSVAAFFDVNIQAPNVNPVQAAQGQRTSSGIEDTQYSPKFSEDRTMSPKEFLLEKQPKSDVERVACLAYYLTYYRDISQFKTLEISKLNTEAAQRKFSNASLAVNNANTSGFLVPATKGNKQISAQGELFVQALPDRDAAREAMTHFKRKPRKKSRTSANKHTNKGK